MVDTYTSLHVHSEYSSALLGFTDSIIHIKDALNWCYEHGLRGMSLSDHEGCSGFVEMEQAVNKMSLERPFQHIFANEIYLLSEQENELKNDPIKRPHYWHFLLNCLDEEGIHMLYELSSRAWLRSYVYRGLRRRPTFYSDIEEVIGKNQGHIVGSSACLGGYLPHLILDNNKSKAKEFISWGVKTFGEGNFFLECQPCLGNNEEQLKVNKALWQLHEELNVPIIVTTDAHYLEAKDRLIHKAYLASKDGGDTREADSFYMTAHLFSPSELRDTLHVCFDNNQIDLLFQTTNEIADRVKPVSLKKTTQVPALPSLPEFKIVHKYKHYYPKYEFINYFANSLDPYEQYYYYQIEKGLIKHEATHNIDLDKYLNQINTEMEQVKGLGDIFDHQRMCDYFTVVQKVIDLIWSNGDSLVGIGRGSAGCYVTNFLLGITGIDPQREELTEFYPWWRFCSTARSDSIFDIDIDIESFQKEKIIQAIKDYFGERRVCQVVTWGKLSARTAIERACRGMGISMDVAGYLRSLVPVKRGAIYSLNDCLYGNEKKGRSKVPGFANELNKYPGLLDTALAFEGLIISSGVHAGALNVLKSDFTDTGALMVSPNGAIINQYDLHHGEYHGQLKFDLLSIDALCCIRSCLNLLLENKKIDWQGSLRKTYNHYLRYDVLEQNDKKMWELLPTMVNAFQYDTRAGKEALRKIGAQTLTELTLANGLMRLAVSEGEQPMDKYVRYRKDINEWYKDMTAYGIPENEQKILKELLKSYSGLMIAQATTMAVLMDKRVCRFTLKEADKARKAISKKNAEALKETENRLYKKGAECGRSKAFLDYLWNVQIEMSKSYAFDFSHSHEYSTECLQELNLYYKFPKVYWNTAVITTQAQIEDEREGSAVTINYGKIAQSIYKAKSNGIIVKAPSINNSGLAFTPREQDDSILFGLGAISGINNDVVTQILSNRPYTSFIDFYNKNAYKGSLVTKSKFIQLIKAGCFDEFEPDRQAVMRQYFILSTPNVTSLAMNNIAQIKAARVPIPKSIIAPYNFRKYVCSRQFRFGPHPKFKSKTLYWLDNRAQRYFNARCKDSLTEGVDYWFDGDAEKWVVVDKSLEKLLTPSIETLKDYINTHEFLDKFNKARAKQNMIESVDGLDMNRWAFSSISFYPDEHELAHIDKERYNISLFNELPEEPKFITKSYGKRKWKQFALAQIACTVIDKNDNHHMLTVLDIGNNVVQCKFNAEVYSFYKAQLSETDGSGNKIVMDKPWFRRGQTLILAGVRMGVDDFRVKSYKNSIYNHKVLRIDSINNKTGEVEITSYRYGQSPEEN
nr:MAG TPA: DNA polymerase III, alpha subunit [Caudoviricetes sp.]